MKPLPYLSPAKSYAQLLNGNPSPLVVMLLPLLMNQTPPSLSDRIETTIKKATKK